jgi:tetratricopeptide (TPR) repeat protein/peroxiredoxin
MARRQDENHIPSRRTFLKTMGWAPALFLPAPLYSGLGRLGPRQNLQTVALPSADTRVAPRYPVKTPLDDVLRLVAPGSDEFITEKHASEIARALDAWSQGLKTSPPALPLLAQCIDPSVEATPLILTHEVPLRTGGDFEVLRRQFSARAISGRDRFLEDMNTYLAGISHVETAEFLIVGLKEIPGTQGRFRVDIRYDFVGTRSDAGREERVGLWRTQWSFKEGHGWQALRWEASEETLSRARGPIFVDITQHALGRTESYRNQMLHGVDHWRTVLDGACGIEVYGNNGLAAGDIDNDGLDDLYICQPSGLPNRLYRNRGDGTFEDVTEKSGVDVLDATACALFADFENKGLQDLLVVCASGPLLFVNQGEGRFVLKRDAFKFVNSPQGTFTHAAIADYDSDGRLDLYFCLYSYYLGLDQYHYPAPYFDARNGPPNFLFHNEGDGTFQDRTEAAGLHVENDRYSFACAWGDFQSNGRQDLYVANDFGRSNLYRNNGDGTFNAVSADAHVNDAGAGMSACWFDFDNDGKQDIYVANMWSSAGLRISDQPTFHEKDPENIRSFYRQHAGGNSLYRNLGDTKFQNVSESAGVGMGRWAWSSDVCDFDHDGYPDLYVANGYISGPDRQDLASFFWRQVVAKSPTSAISSADYERGWNAINELIRSDHSWSGYERNVFYLNNHDGTFTEASGATGLDFPEDGRAFVLADLDHDGRQELILKNRNAPQLRILHNSMKDIGHSIAFCLRGQKSNRDAIGTAVTVSAGALRQTKYLQAGSGFLSQHSKELFFGLGKNAEAASATIRWPGGLTQTFDRLPANHRVEIQEGSQDFRATPFAIPPAPYAQTGDSPKLTPLPSAVETWLLEPLSAPDFSLPDLRGEMHELQTYRGGFLVLNFWATNSAASIDQVRLFRDHQSIFPSNLRVVGLNVDDPRDVRSMQSFLEKEQIPFPVLLATPETVGIYNLIYRYLFDRRRNLGIPTSFLIDDAGMIVKAYQERVHPRQVIDDVKTVPRTPADRVRRGLPFGGTLHLGEFRRNDFTYGVAMFQRGYLDQATASFKQVIANKPNDPEAHYNLGTLYLRNNALQDARRNLQRAVDLRPEYPEAWNNLGMIAAQEGQTDDAIRNFRHSLQQRPDYTVALLNLGNLYRRQGNVQEARTLLSRALEITPADPEATYSLGMLYARQEQFDIAVQYLERAVALRPEYPDALNNLGVIFVRDQRYPEAEEKFQTCIRVAPNFDQAYLNLARLYVVMKNQAKAREVLQALLRLQPQHKLAQQALGMLQ